MKKNKKELCKRGLACFLAFAMCVSTPQMVAFAADDLGDAVETQETSGSQETVEKQEASESQGNVEARVTVENDTSKDNSSSEGSNKDNDFQYNPGDSGVQQVPSENNTPNTSDGNETSSGTVADNEGSTSTGSPAEDNSVTVEVKIPETAGNSGESQTDGSQTAPEGNQSGESQTAPEGSQSGESQTAPEGNQGGESQTAPEGNQGGESQATSEGNQNSETGAGSEGNANSESGTTSEGDKTKEPVAENTEKFKVDEKTVLDDIEKDLKKDLTLEEGYTESNGTYTKGNTSVKIEKDGENGFKRVETTVETKEEIQQLDEGKEFVVPDGATDVTDNGFTYTKTDENGAKIVQTVTKNADGTYTVKTETTTVKTIIKRLEKVEDGTVTVKVYEAEGTSELKEVTGDNPTVKSDVTGKYNDFLFDAKNDLYDREGFKAIKTVKINTKVGSLSVRKGNGTSYGSWVEGKLAKDTIVYVYEEKTGTDGRVWYRIGEDAWIASEYTKEIYNENKQDSNVMYEVLPDEDKDRLYIVDAKGNKITYWVPHDEIKIYSAKSINGKVYYECRFKYNGKDTIGYVPAEEVKKIVRPSYTSEDLKELDSEWILKYFGETALESAIRIDNNEGGNDSIAKIRILRDKNGNPYYVYCVEHGIQDRNGYKYKMISLDETDEAKLIEMAKELGIVNKDETDDERLKKGLENLQHIMAIAANGYWGATNDKTEADEKPVTGSLDALRQKVLADLEAQKTVIEKLKEQGKADEKKLAELDNIETAIEALKNGLTDGVALTATQAALWSYSYGKSPDTADFGKWIEFIGEFYNTEMQPDGDRLLIVKDTYKKLEELAEKSGDYSKIQALQAVYTWLINTEGKSNSMETRPDAITEDNFLTDVAVKVNKLDAPTSVADKDIRKAAQELSKADGNSPSEDTYDVDVSFTMAVVPNVNDDSLTVTVYVDGKPQRIVRIAGKQTEGEQEAIYSENGSYTIKGIKLPNGKTIKIELNGTQNMGRGVYVFTSEKKNDLHSQSFIGISETDRYQEIGLSVEINFKVDSATAEIVTENREYKVTNTIETREKRRPNDPQNPPSSERPPRTPSTPRERTTTTTRNVPNPVVPLANIPGPAVPLANIADTEVPLATILDEDVPLANVPRTGDNSHIWALFALISGLGLAWLGLDGKKRGENAR